MENLDLLVLRELRDWRRAGQRALLATVVRTWGSSPRPVGSILADPALVELAKRRPGSLHGLEQICAGGFTDTAEVLFLISPFERREQVPEEWMGVHAL